jgi:hypothetical protein
MEYTFYIKSLEFLENFENFEKVITRVFYEYKCTYIDGKLYYGNCIILNKPTSNYIEFQNITENNILEWIYDKINHEEIKKEMEISIDILKKNNNLTITTPPWIPIQSGSTQI